jgi:hypothetical protein
MSITFHFRPNERLVIAVHVGAAPDDEFLASYKGLYDHARFDISFSQLIDLRQADSSARSSAALASLADFVRGRLKGTTPPKVAVIAPQDLSFGLARMYEVFTDAVPWDFVVFRAADAALAWLGVPETLMDDLQPLALHEK